SGLVHADKIALHEVVGRLEIRGSVEKDAVAVAGNHVARTWCGPTDDIVVRAPKQHDPITVAYGLRATGIGTDVGALDDVVKSRIGRRKSRLQGAVKLDPREITADDVSRRGRDASDGGVGRVRVDPVLQMADRSQCECTGAVRAQVIALHDIVLTAL